MQQEKTINEQALPCSNCGSNDIGVKDAVVYTPWRTELRKVWAYCRGCNLKGKASLCDMDMSQADEVKLAYKAWNIRPKSSVKKTLTKNSRRK